MRLSLSNLTQIQLDITQNQMEADPNHHHHDKEKDDPEKRWEEQLLSVLRQVVQRCIHQDISKRPSASEIEEFLKPYLDGEMANGIHEGSEIKEENDAS